MLRLYYDTEHYSIQKAKFFDLDDPHTLYTQKLNFGVLKARNSSPYFQVVNEVQYRFWDYAFSYDAIDPRLGSTW